MPKIIDSFSGKNRFLSNFYKCKFYTEGITYSSVEHYFQAQKAIDPHWFDLIAFASSPGEAKKIGGRCPLRPNWEQIKDDIMLQGLRKKFLIPNLQKKLLQTGDAVLVEGNSWGDRYWGVYLKKGKNKLGKLLMQVREEISNGKEKV